MCRRHREQARLPQGFVPGAEPRCTADPGWERACSRKRLICHINAGCAAVIASKLGSHRVLCLAQSLGAQQIQGGSEPARDSGGSVGIDDGCVAVIASKLAPTGFFAGRGVAGYSRSRVGASLLAIAVGLLALMMDVSPPSRASSLPQFFLPGGELRDTARSHKGALAATEQEFRAGCASPPAALAIQSGCESPHPARDRRPRPCPPG